MAETTSASSVPPKTRLDKYGYNCIARHISLAVFVCVPLFIGAGRVDWQWGWIYSVTTLLGWSGLSLVLARENPELLNQRGKRTKQMGAGTKRWDWMILGIYSLLLLLTPFIAGLDYRYGWSAPTPVILNILGIILLVFSFVLLTWAMAVNRFFEGTVRIQQTRGQQTITSGPYHYVRHPGYVAVILQFIAVPLAVGSIAAWIPAMLGSLLFIMRTALEDRTLQQELSGYTAFTKQTRYRLIPGIW
jgi:protein-S-isoprenylcysteine O-methyltransferase Ste14